MHKLSRHGNNVGGLFLMIFVGAFALIGTLRHYPSLVSHTRQEDSPIQMISGMRRAAPAGSSSSSGGIRPLTGIMSLYHYTPSPDAPLLEGFVRVQNGRFMLSDKPFLVSGWNSYYFIDLWAHENPVKHKAGIDTVLTGGARIGLNVLRTWAFNDGMENHGQALQRLAGVYNEEAFRFLDYTLHQASLHGIRVVMPLVNYKDEYGGVRQYLKWANKSSTAYPASSHEDFYTNPICREMYKRHVATVVDRVNVFNGRKYKDDPAIFAWDLANEPRSQARRDGADMLAWVRHMSEYLHTVDANHMVTTGMEGWFGASVPELQLHNPPTDLDAPMDDPRASDWLSSEGSDFVAHHKQYYAPTPTPAPAPEPSPITTHGGSFRRRSTLEMPISGFTSAASSSAAVARTSAGGSSSSSSWSSDALSSRSHSDLPALMSSSSSFPFSPSSPPFSSSASSSSSSSPATSSYSSSGLVTGSPGDRAPGRPLASPDYATIRVWSHWWPRDSFSFDQILDKCRAWLAAHDVVASQLLGMPLVLEEFGEHSDGRQQFFDMAYDVIEDSWRNGGAFGGSSFWMMADKAYKDYDGYTIYPEDPAHAPMTDLIARHVERRRGFEAALAGQGPMPAPRVSQLSSMPAPTSASASSSTAAPNSATGVDGAGKTRLADPSGVVGNARLVGTGGGSVKRRVRARALISNLQGKGHPPIAEMAAARPWQVAAGQAPDPSIHPSSKVAAHLTGPVPGGVKPRKSASRSESENSAPDLSLLERTQRDVPVAVVPGMKMESNRFGGPRRRLPVIPVPAELERSQDLAGNRIEAPASSRRVQRREAPRGRDRAVEGKGEAVEGRKRLFDLVSELFPASKDSYANDWAAGVARRPVAVDRQAGGVTSGRVPAEDVSVTDTSGRKYYYDGGEGAGSGGGDIPSHDRGDKKATVGHSYNDSYSTVGTGYADVYSAGGDEGEIRYPGEGDAVGDGEEVTSEEFLSSNSEAQQADEPATETGQEESESGTGIVSDGMTDYDANGRMKWVITKTGEGYYDEPDGALDHGGFYEEAYEVEVAG
eukprot:jgi/Mesvir1/468/Mv11343-RA.1